jgi:HEAT repeat protein
MGSGFLVNAKDRLIITNHHVVNKASGTFWVLFVKYDEEAKLITNPKSYEDDIDADGERYKGRVLYSSEAKDLAIVQLDSLPAGVEPLPFAKESAAPGQVVHSVGNAGAAGSLWGYIPGVVRTHPQQEKWVSRGGDQTFIHDAKVVKTEAPVNPGDSGGPTVNDHGELVAVTQGYKPTARSVSSFVDVSEVKSVLTLNGYAWTEGRATTAKAKFRLTVVEVSKLKDLLDHRNAKVRAKAATYLGEGGPESRGAVPALISALQDKNLEVRRMTSIALGQIGSEASASLDPLTLALKDPDRVVRHNVVRSIQKIGPKGEKLAAALSEFAAQADAELQEQALITLAKLGPDATAALPGLARILNKENTKLHALARNVFEQMGDARQPALCSLLEDASAKVRSQAATLLGEGGVTFRGTVPALTKSLQDVDTEVRRCAAHALGSIGKEAMSALPALASAFKDRDREVRTVALSSVRKIGPKGSELALPLVALLAEPDAEMQEAAFQALLALGSDGEEAVAKLVEARDGTQLKSRQFAVQVLAKLTSGNEELLPVFLKGLDNGDPVVRRHTVATLVGLEPRPESTAAFLGRIQDADAEVRRLAGQGLERATTFTKEQLPLLSTALKNDQVTVRAAAARGLGKLGQDAASAADDLIESLDDSDLGVRTAAASALTSTDVRSKRAIEPLYRLLPEPKIDSKTTEKNPRRVAAIALGKVGPEAIPSLGKALKGGYSDACSGIALIGAPAKDLIPEIRDLLRDPSTVDEAIDALVSIGPSVVPKLLEMNLQFQKKNPTLQIAAVAVFERLGPDAKQALPVLQDMMYADARPEVRQAAASAYRKIKR